MATLEEIAEKYLLPVVLVAIGGIVSAYLATAGPLPVAFALLLVVLAFAGLYLGKQSRMLTALRAAPETRVKDLLRQLSQLQTERSSLRKDLDEWMETAWDEKTARGRVEKELADLKLKVVAVPPEAPKVESTTALATPAAIAGHDWERDAALLRPQLKQIARLRRFRAPLQGKERTEFVHWRTKTSELLWRVLGADSVHPEDFDNIDFEAPILASLPISLSDPAEVYAKGLDEAEALLKTVIEVSLAS